MASETIADIVAEKRHRADEIERDVSAKMASGKMVSDQYAREVIADLRNEADRIEEAREHEHQPLTIAEWIDKTETVADIAAVLRRYVLPSLAERLEAAWKRERAFNAMTEAANERLREHLQIALEGNKKPVGNAAALREVCVKCRELAEVIWQSECGEDVSSEIAELRDLLNFALAAPARNCDCYKDADSAYIAFCGYDFAAKDISDSAFIDWLLAPAAGRKGDGDGR